MTHRAKLIAALSVSACVGFALAVFVLPTVISAAPPTFPAAAQVPDRTAICRSEPEGSAFHSELVAANERMHVAMDAAPRGDIDLDFTRMMIPHHQGAIDMALALLKYGQNEKVRRLAQSIVVEQSQEIVYMRTLLDPPNETAPAAEHVAHQ